MFSSVRLHPHAAVASCWELPHDRRINSIDFAHDHGPNTPSSEISQEDDCSSLLGCMTSALSCMSGGLPTGDGSMGSCLAIGEESRKGLDSGDGSVSMQSSTGALNQVRSCTDPDGVGRNKSGASGGKRSKEQKTTRVCIYIYIYIYIYVCVCACVPA
ncbi:unnamed protein product [Dibothriocephalus latus]|uniref:Uncharacterized protein n=1 Tax=Dibothriocephalus latus TaxID=60516 RepID=A0A3P7NXZ8_DIBLA|nr:unnamed protein product [Dibothriocephalus latus]